MTLIKIDNIYWHICWAVQYGFTYAHFLIHKTTNYFTPSFKESYHSFFNISYLILFSLITIIWRSFLIIYFYFLFSIFDSIKSTFHNDNDWYPIMGQCVKCLMRTVIFNALRHRYFLSRFNRAGNRGTEIFKRLLKMEGKSKAPPWWRPKPWWLWSQLPRPTWPPTLPHTTCSGWPFLLLWPWFLSLDNFLCWIFVTYFIKYEFIKIRNKMGIFCMHYLKNNCVHIFYFSLLNMQNFCGKIRVMVWFPWGCQLVIFKILTFYSFSNILLNE